MQHWVSDYNVHFNRVLLTATCVPRPLPCPPVALSSRSHPDCLMTDLYFRSTRFTGRIQAVRNDPAGQWTTQMMIMILHSMHCDPTRVLVCRVSRRNDIFIGSPMSVCNLPQCGNILARKCRVAFGFLSAALNLIYALMILFWRDKDAEALDRVALTHSEA